MKSILITLFSALVLPVVAQNATAPTSQTLPGQTAPARSPLRAIGNTQYTPHTELFAEYRPLLVNAPGRFTAHLTQVGELFKPYTDAEVTLTLTIDGKTAYQETVKKPAAPGTYRFPVKSEATGTGTVTIALTMPTYSETFTIDNVTVYADEPAALVAQGKTPGEAVTGEITYAKEKSWFEPFATAPVGPAIKKAKGALMVPQTAVLTDQGVAYVLVQRDPEHFRKQTVQTGKRVGNTVEITGGLQPGERIVTIGANKIN